MSEPTTAEPWPALTVLQVRLGELDGPAVVAAYVGAEATDPGITDSWAEALELVAEHLGLVGVPAVPPATLARAVKETASELYHRRQSPQGVANWATTEGPPVRVSRDAMAATRIMLRPYVGGGFA